MTLSAVCKIASGTVSRRDLAVLRLKMNSNLHGRSMGRSPDFAPLKILATSMVHCSVVAPIFEP